MRYVELNAAALKKIMQEQGLKQWWVAEYSHMHKTTFRRWLSGETVHTPLERAKEVAKLLKVELESFCHPSRLKCPKKRHLYKNAPPLLKTAADSTESYEWHLGEQPGRLYEI